MTKKKNEPTDGTFKASFTLDPIPQYVTMCETAQTTCNVVQKGPSFATDKLVQDAVGTMGTRITDLKATNASIAAAHLTIQTLEPQRALGAAALHRANDSLEIAISNSTGGIRAAIIAYGAKIAGPTPSVPSTEPPTKVAGKSKPGSLAPTFACKADPRAICYHYAWGTDPNNPDAWTNTAIGGGARFTATGSFTAGQKIYFRIAIQRRKTGLGAWSGVVQVTIA